MYENLGQEGCQFCIHFVKRGGVFCFWLQLIREIGDTIDIDDSVASARKWRFSAKTENKDARFRMEFSGTVHPLDLRVKQVIETEECLQLKNKHVEKLVAENKIRISFEVFKD